jgi:hypothetical protein
MQVVFTGKDTRVEPAQGVDSAIEDRINNVA